MQPLDWPGAQPISPPDCDVPEGHSQGRRTVPPREHPPPEQPHRSEAVGQAPLPPVPSAGVLSTTPFGLKQPPPSVSQGSTLYCLPMAQETQRPVAMHTPQAWLPARQL
jgi:hypothetical protein